MMKIVEFLTADGKKYVKKYAETHKETCHRCAFCNMEFYDEVTKCGYYGYWEEVTE